MTLVGHQGEVLHCESGKVLEQAAQIGCGCPVPGGVQGQVRWGPGQPELVGSSPAHRRRVGNE